MKLNKAETIKALQIEVQKQCNNRLNEIRKETDKIRKEIKSYLNKNSQKVKLSFRVSYSGCIEAEIDKKKLPAALKKLLKKYKDLQEERYDINRASYQKDRLMMELVRVAGDHELLVNLASQVVSNFKKWESK